MQIHISKVEVKLFYLFRLLSLVAHGLSLIVLSRSYALGLWPERLLFRGFCYCGTWALKYMGFSSCGART